MKKILVLDNSALMRRNLSDIIEKTGKHRVCYYASNQYEAVTVLNEKTDISVVIACIDIEGVNVDRLLYFVKAKGYKIKLIFWGSKSYDEFKKKHENEINRGLISYIGNYNKHNVYCTSFENEIIAVIQKSHIGLADNELRASRLEFNNSKPITVSNIQFPKASAKSHKLVAIACSTGGPKALHAVLGRLPANLAAPVMIVQHMPANFTKGLADRLNNECEIKIKEAEDNEMLVRGVCYIAKGGKHLVCESNSRGDRLRFNDKPAVSGLKPYGNIMYESLCDSQFEEIICVVLTGMGNDGCEGINTLSRHKNIYVIAQDEETSTVYGMPRAIYESGIVNKVCGIDDVADNIIKKVGVL